MFVTDDLEKVNMILTNKEFENPYVFKLITIFILYPLNHYANPIPRPIAHHFFQPNSLRLFFNKDLREERLNRYPSINQEQFQYDLHHHRTLIRRSLLAVIISDLFPY